MTDKNNKMTIKLEFENYAKVNIDALYLSILLTNISK